MNEPKHIIYLRVPASIYQEAKRAAKACGQSLNQFCSDAIQGAILAGNHNEDKQQNGQIDPKGRRVRAPSSERTMD